MPIRSGAGNGVYTPPAVPPQRRRKVPIWSVVPDDVNYLRPYQSEVVRVGTHWAEQERRTWLCAGPEMGCAVCAGEPKWRWTGYILARLEPIHHMDGQKRLRSQGTVILHITEHAALHCPQLSDGSLDLTQHDLICERVGKTKRAPVLIHTRFALSRPIVPSSFDLLAYLLEMYSAPNNDARRAARKGANE